MERWNTFLHLTEQAAKQLFDHAQAVKGAENIRLPTVHNTVNGSQVLREIPYAKARFCTQCYTKKLGSARNAIRKSQILHICRMTQWSKNVRDILEQ